MILPPPIHGPTTDHDESFGHIQPCSAMMLMKERARAFLRFWVIPGQFRHLLLPSFWMACVFNFFWILLSMRKIKIKKIKSKMKKMKNEKKKIQKKEMRSAKGVSPIFNQPWEGLVWMLGGLDVQRTDRTGRRQQERETLRQRDTWIDRDKKKRVMEGH